MTLAGWVLMLLSCGFVLILMLFCFWRLLTTPGATEQEHGLFDINTHDPQE